MISAMKGSHRQLLLLACDEFAQATKTAQKKCEAAFLPTLEADSQAERVGEAKDRIPPFDDVARSWESPQPLTFVYRNAIVVFARAVDKIRDKEKDATISTADSDSLIEDLQSMLEALGDQRNLESVLKSARNREAVEGKPPKDPLQMEISDTNGEPFHEPLKKGRAVIPGVSKATGERKATVSRSAKLSS